MYPLTVAGVGISVAMFTLTLTSCEPTETSYSATRFHLDSGQIIVEVPAVDVGGAFVTQLFLADERPWLGRFFDQAEHQADEPAVAVLSHDLWVEHFRSLPGVVGSQITVNGSSVTVVGVAPPGFGPSRAGLVWLPN
jgi:MacB-like periplasmic core domain